MLLMGGGKLEGTHRLAVDRKDAIFKAVKHLADLGHRRIAFVGAATDKLVGFTLGLLDFKLEYKEDSIIYYSSPGGFPEEQLTKVLRQDRHSRPTAFIFDAHNHIFSFIQLTMKLRLRIPQDLSLVVYDNIPEMEIFSTCN